MACSNEIHVGDIGTKFLVTIMDGTALVDISSATTMEIIVKKPDASTTTWTAVHETDGTDGKLQYTTSQATDLNLSGTWQLQARVVLPSGDWKSCIQKFKVYANL